ncbi:hypothetical protein MB84_31490 (plasmid) [Pandoraea oxalativorans]|uniref:Uncharacterized protein n=1 Tax=Pandoraea oxalativorans TaxID=573737 RepID=A0A192B128_9BURK|nr:hypothetical protein MB84_31490 [Pandoraea oxalativorans]
MPFIGQRIQLQVDQGGLGQVNIDPVKELPTEVVQLVGEEKGATEFAEFPRITQVNFIRTYVDGRRTRPRAANIRGMGDPHRKVPLLILVRSIYSTGSPPPHSHSSQNALNWELKTVSMQNVASVAIGGVRKTQRFHAPGTRSMKCAANPPKKPLSVGMARVLKHVHDRLEVMGPSVRWHVAYPLRSSELEDMVVERGVVVNPSAIPRRVNKVLPVFGRCRNKATADNGGLPFQIRLEMSRLRNP